MENSQKVVLKPSIWNEQAAQLLAGAAGNDPTYSMADLENEINRGSATLYAVGIGGALAGYVVLWLDDFGGTKELVIQSGRALSNSALAIKLTLPALADFARQRGAISMRAHSNDPAMIKLLTRFGFKKSEIVLRAQV